MNRSKFRTITLVALVGLLASLAAAPSAGAATGPTALITSPAGDLTTSGTGVNLSAHVTAGSGAFVVEAELTVGGRVSERYVYTGTAQSNVTLMSTLNTDLRNAPLWDNSMVHNFASVGIQAWVLDSNGQYVESSVVQVTISNPRGYLTQPHDGDLVQLGQTRSWAATTETAGDRVITEVELYVGSTLAATDTTAPFGGTFVVPSNVRGTALVSIAVHDSGGDVWESAYTGSATVQVQEPVLRVLTPSGVFGAPGVQMPVSVVLQGVAAGFQPVGGATIYNSGPPLTGVSLPWSGTVTVPATGTGGIIASVTSLNLSDGVDMAPLDATTKIAVTAPAATGATAPPKFKAQLPTLLAGERPTGSFVLDGRTTLTADVQNGQLVVTNPAVAWSATPGTHTVQARFDGVTPLPTGSSTERRLASDVVTFTVPAPTLTLTAPTPGQYLHDSDTWATDAPTDAVVQLVDGAVPIVSCRIGPSPCALQNIPQMYGPAQVHAEVILAGTDTAAATSSSVGVVFGDSLADMVGLPASGGLTTPTLVSWTATTCRCESAWNPFTLVVDGVPRETSWDGSPFSVAPLAWGTGAHRTRVDVTLDDGEVLAGPEHSVTVPDPGPVPRVGGMDRYGTAGGLSSSFQADGPPFAILASATTFPDALAGAAAAGAYGAPVLLGNSGDGLPAWTEAELVRLHAKAAIILGGTNQVSMSNQIVASHLVDGPVLRITGRDRYETAALLSSALYDPGVPVVYISTGLQFPDALSGAALAGTRGVPLLMTAPGALPSSVVTELKRLKPASIVVLGGPIVVSNTVVTQLHSYTTGAVTRLYGADRYATSAAIAAQFPGTVPQAFLATGASFADALAAGAVAGWRQEPLLLTSPTALPSVIAAQLTRLAPSQVVVAGGPVSVPEAVRLQVVDLLFPAGGGALRVPNRASTVPIASHGSWTVPPASLASRLTRAGG